LTGDDVTDKLIIDISKTINIPTCKRPARKRMIFSSGWLSMG
jgi:hypothetical protein